MSSNALETRGLTARFGGVLAVDGVDFNLRQGELRCLIGPNGAGKSTFFKCLTGQMRPSGGDIWIDGENTAGWPPHRIARLGVGVKTQTPSVMDGLSARENIWLAARRGPDAGAGSVRTAAVDAAERLGVTEFIGAKVGDLAHGQRQRVELAMVFAARPSLILLDEPAAGLSREETGWLADIIRDAARTASVIVVEHDMSFVRGIADEITVFHRGATLAEGGAEAVLSDARVREVYLGRDGHDGH